MTFTFSEVLALALYFMNVLLPHLLIAVGIVAGAWIILAVVDQVRGSL